MPGLEATASHGPECACCPEQTSRYLLDNHSVPTRMGSIFWLEAAVMTA